MSSASTSSARPVWGAPDWILLVVLVALAAALRLPTLGTWSFWIDEAFTIHDAVFGMATQFKYRPSPVNYWLVGFTMELLGGVNEWNARLAPCIAGILSVGVTFAFTRRRSSRGVATLAALFIALSSWHIYWSQNARHYSPLLLVTTISAFLGYEAIDRRNIALGVFSLILLFVGWETHRTGLLIGPVLLGFAALRYGPTVFELRGRSRMAVLIATCLVVVVIGLAGFRVLSAIMAMKPSGTPVNYVVTLAHYVGVPFFPAAFAGLLYAYRADSTWGKFLLMYGLAPVAVIGVASLLTTATALYAYTALPALCILAAHGCTGFARMRRGGTLAVAVLAAILLLHQAGETMKYFQYRHGDRPRWREAAEFIIEHNKNPRLAVASNMSPVLSHYLGEETGHLREGRRALWLGADTLEKFMKSEQDGRRYWVVLLNSQLGSWDRDWAFRSWLKDNAELVEEFPAWTDVKDRTIRIYRSRGPAPMVSEST